jgi:hypothetical protein
MLERALAGINSFASVLDKGLSPNAAQPHKHAFLRIFPKREECTLAEVV